MSYQVLARKWRPKNFQQLMGQEHVVSVLVNALSQKRLHHAYLFTGTRGVGKTTIARIFAKSLNCETGITEKPCGVCAACVDIDQGRFVDLLEIDAASKTKVDDTREILDNVQYAPSRGRFKVYLIDEVHMLSRHSFNALLKTLEEPPEHVKFILATTDPQKLPITVLSRCLQFHLKALTVKQIEDKLAEILSQEKVNHEQGCLTLLAKAARGSMRDSLSLTDQAIAQGQGNISLANIQQMLGGIDQNWVYQLVIALLKQDSQSLMSLSQEMASYAPSYNRLFAELIQLFHQIALMQIVEQPFDLPDDLLVLLKKFSQAMSAEDVQLYYQIALNGRKDLPYASDEQAAFDMTLLRLFAFKPMQKSHLPKISDVTHSKLNKEEFTDISFNKATPTTSVSKEPLQTKLDDDNNDNTVEQANITENTAIVSEEALTREQSRTVDAPTVEVINNEDVIKDNSHYADNDYPYNAYEESSYAGSSTEDSRDHSELTAQMFGVEQQTAALIDNGSELPEHIARSQFSSVQKTQTHNSSENTKQDSYERNNSTLTSSEQVKTDSIDSPVSSILATRNMLRSRKKAMENQTKKSNDATMRQPNSKINSNVATLESTIDAHTAPNAPVINAPVVIVPEPEIPFHQDNIDPTIVTKANQVDKWAHMIDSMQLTARVRQLAIHATISEDSTDDNLILQLDQATRHLNTEFAQEQLQTYICEFLARQVTVTLNVVEETVADPYQIQVQINDKRLEYAKTVIKEDSVVIALQNTFQATLDEESISAR
ncbi:DNA polymerase III subunit gamma/tau [Colwellia echini]|uniref:DNA polymerase III subunit gamma/tau n=1 Tax=Colwellia echini TaxID=1982103 RepID=A0ABY3MZH6_9GAMM|nr:DNA polymerase III subunit gamma/tau [Colwellia echini]TYK66412.1 DNA polymerase III subunit gamma/tau [Colwellia echini]